MPDKAPWSIIVHGGAGRIKPEKEEASRRAALDALARGVEVLRRGDSALMAVEKAIETMEKGGVFNAGKGSVTRTDGEVYMDASIMDGKNLSIGAVTGIQGVETPISVARLLMGEAPILLAGEHAVAYAKAQGFKIDKKKPSSDPGPSSDTVGCVALDIDGNIACGLSTGGLTSRMPGGVGDAPLPGCGFYADNMRGGLCFSGDGESIARVMLAAEVLNRLEHMEPEDAIEDGLKLLDRVNGEAGCILIDKKGNLAWSHRSDNYAVAYQTSDTEPFVSLKKSRVGSA